MIQRFDMETVFGEFSEQEMTPNANGNYVRWSDVADMQVVVDALCDWRLCKRDAASLLLMIDNYILSQTEVTR